MSDTPAPPSARPHVAVRAGSVVGAVALGVVGLLLPTSPLVGGYAWLGFLLACFAGWGALAARLTRAALPDVGLQIAWGMSLVLALAGVLIAAGICTRPVLLGLLGVGLAGFACTELTSARPLLVRVYDLGTSALRHPAVALAGLALAILATVVITRAITATDRNPWDDDLAYLPLVQRLLDAGDLVEPFSFRRLSAYGGQTVLSALVAARGSLDFVHVADKALCLIVTILLAIGAGRDRGTRAPWVLALVLVVLALPDASINTAAHWSGVALFLALYRTALRRDAVLVGLVGAAACTLRQNYIAVVVVFTAISLALELRARASQSSWRDGWRSVRGTWLATTAAAVIAIAPWWIAAYRSSETFLFPLVSGTWNHELSLAPTAMSWADELAYILWATVETRPLVVMPALVAVLLMTGDRRRGRPVIALFAASVLGFIAVVHGFAGTDPFHLWRYAMGFAVALAIVLVIEAGATRDDGIVLAAAGRWLLAAALGVQLLASGAILRAARESEIEPPPTQADRVQHAALQAKLPADARLLVMLDRPYLLDFARNDIANLDTPGFASPPPQLPAFEGAEALRRYLLGQGYRYVAFVRSESSRFFFHRPFWVWRLFNDAELFAAMSAYAIDAIDSFAELATTSRVLHDEHGLVLLDLDSRTGGAAPAGAATTESQRRESWVERLVAAEGLEHAWAVSSRGGLRLEGGVGPLSFVPPGLPATQLVRARKRTEMVGKPVRPLQRRAHLRVRGTEAMRLRLTATLTPELARRMRLEVSFDGGPAASFIADEAGRYAVDVTFTREQLARGWHDLYLVFAGTSPIERDARDLRVAWLERATWEPAR